MRDVPDVHPATSSSFLTMPIPPALRRMQVAGNGRRAFEKTSGAVLQSVLHGPQHSSEQVGG